MKRSSALTLLVLLFSIVGCTPMATPSPTAIPPATAVPAPKEETNSWETVLSVEVAYPFRADVDALSIPR